MAKIMSRMMKRNERGMALMLALFALLLLSGIGLCMVLWLPTLRHALTLTMAAACAPIMQPTPVWKKCATGSVIPPRPHRRSG